MVRLFSSSSSRMRGRSGRRGSPPGNRGFWGSGSIESLARVCPRLCVSVCGIQILRCSPFANDSCNLLGLGRLYYSLRHSCTIYWHECFICCEIFRRGLMNRNQVVGLGRCLNMTPCAFFPRVILERSCACRSYESMWARNIIIGGFRGIGGGLDGHRGLSEVP